VPTIKPRDTRIDCQIKAAHYFHMYAILDCVDFSQYKALLDVTLPIQQIPFGILLKNETKCEDMLGIMDHLHQYVPTVTLDYSYVDQESAEIVVPVNHIYQIMVYI